MDTEKKITVTKEGLEKLQQELEYLKTVKRKEVTEAIRVALSFGDLSENSEYDEAKTEQAKTEARVTELEEMLKNVVLIEEDLTTDKVSVGMKVKVRNKTAKKEVEYTLVGSTEANPILRRISDDEKFLRNRLPGPPHHRPGRRRSSSRKAQPDLLSSPNGSLA